MWQEALSAGQSICWMSIPQHANGVGPRTQTCGALRACPRTAAKVRYILIAVAARSYLSSRVLASTQCAQVRATLGANESGAASSRPGRAPASSGSLELRTPRSAPTSSPPSCAACMYLSRARRQQVTLGRLCNADVLQSSVSEILGRAANTALSKARGRTHPYCTAIREPRQAKIDSMATCRTWSRYRELS
jgi:hypothetical protein